MAREPGFKKVGAQQSCHGLRQRAGFLAGGRKAVQVDDDIGRLSRPVSPGDAFLGTRNQAVLPVNEFLGLREPCVEIVRQGRLMQRAAQLAGGQ